MYVIELKSGGYIGRGELGQGYVVYSNLFQARVFTEKKKAENVLRSSIPKKWKPECFVVEKGYELVEESWAMSQLSALQKTIAELHDKCNSHMKELYDSLSRVDKELQDLLHYVENVNLNACDGYKAFKMIQVKRRERRKIKVLIQEASITNNIYRMNQAIDGMLCEIYEANQSKGYRPRCYPELFKRDSREMLYDLINGEEHGQQNETA